MLNRAKRLKQSPAGGEMRHLGVPLLSSQLKTSAEVHFKKLQSYSFFSASITLIQYTHSTAWHVAAIVLFIMAPLIPQILCVCMCVCLWVIQAFEREKKRIDLKKRRLREEKHELWGKDSKTLPQGMTMRCKTAWEKKKGIETRRKKTFKGMWWLYLFYSIDTKGKFLMCISHVTPIVWLNWVNHVLLDSIRCIL